MIKRIFAHLTIVISVMMIVLVCIDSVNPAMGFLKGGVFTTLLYIYIGVAIVAAALSLAAGARAAKKRRESGGK